MPGVLRTRRPATAPPSSSPSPLPPPSVHLHLHHPHQHIYNHHPQHDCHLHRSHYIIAFTTPTQYIITVVTAVTSMWTSPLSSLPPRSSSSPSPPPSPSSSPLIEATIIIIIPITPIATDASSEPPTKPGCKAFSRAEIFKLPFCWLARAFLVRMQERRPRRS